MFMAGWEIVDLVLTFGRNLPFLPESYHMLRQAARAGVSPPRSRRRIFYAIDCNRVPLDHKFGGLSPGPFVVSLIWLVALSGGLIVLLVE